MEVRVVETGYDPPSERIDLAGGWPHQSSDFGRVADGSDAPVPDRDVCR
jgi:hypothetical protein